MYVYCNLHCRNFIQYSVYEWGGSCYVCHFFSSFSHLANILNMCIYEVMSVGCRFNNFNVRTN